MRLTAEYITLTVQLLILRQVAQLIQLIQEPIITVDPEGPKPCTDGPLSIDYASNFNFGTQEITSADKTYFAAATTLTDKTTRPNWVQVTDNRGTLAGWSLSLQASEFTNGKTGTGSVLSGATLKLENGHIVSASDAAADQSVASVTLTPNFIRNNPWRYCR